MSCDSQRSCQEPGCQELGLSPRSPSGPGTRCQAAGESPRPEVTGGFPPGGTVHKHPHLGLSPHKPPGALVPTQLQAEAPNCRVLGSLRGDTPREAGPGPEHRSSKSSGGWFRRPPPDAAHAAPGKFCSRRGEAKAVSLLSHLPDQQVKAQREWHRGQGTVPPFTRPQSRPSGCSLQDRRPQSPLGISGEPPGGSRCLHGPPREASPLAPSSRALPGMALLFTLPCKPPGAYVPTPSSPHHLPPQKPQPLHP